MERLNLLKAGCSVLDIGSSNLYSAEASQIAGFIDKYSPGTTDSDAFSRRLAAGSGYDPVKGGLNESFFGELIEKAGMEYLSFDIADGFKTLILDLNRAVLPENLCKKFDLVLNFGTTEHILNQFNCFKVMHDATRVGGHIYHSLPTIGYVDHGYITYTGRCFFDIAGYNEYEIVDFWFEGPVGNNNLFESLRSYRSYFPVLEKALSEIDGTARGSSLNALGIPDVGINVIYRKNKDKPFWGALEASTSVGAIPGQVTDLYAGNDEQAPVSKGLGSLPLRQGANSGAPIETTPKLVGEMSRVLRRFPAIHRFVREAYRNFKKP